MPTKPEAGAKKPDMRDLPSSELALVSGGFGGCDEATGDEINVCAPYPPPDLPSYPPSPPPPASYEPPIGSPPSSGGGGVSLGIPVPVDADCPGAAAVAIADAIKATAFPGAIVNWFGSEFATYVVPTSTGGFGASQGKIYTDGLVDGATFPEPDPGVRPVGFIHNHPDLLGADALDAHNRYPSTLDFVGSGSDYEQLERMVTIFGNGDPTYDPSAWIVDSKGVVREFKWSERESWANLTRAERIDGKNLPPAETACGG